MTYFIDRKWMKIALQYAFYAKKIGEIPIGSIVVLKNNIVGIGWNSSILKNDPTAHAEIIALRNTGKYLKNYRFNNATLYVTLEPCIMCCGAIVHSRIKRLVFGANYQKNNHQNVLKHFFRHFKKKIIIEENVMQEECSKLLSSFFQNKRKK